MICFQETGLISLREMRTLKELWQDASFYDGYGLSKAEACFQLPSLARSSDFFLAPL
jgi:hypothetical protein